MCVCIGIARRVANGVGIRGGRVPTPSPRTTNAMHCLVLLLPCLARTYRQEQRRAGGYEAPVGGADDQQEPYQSCDLVYVRRGAGVHVCLFEGEVGGIRRECGDGGLRVGG